MRVLIVGAGVVGSNLARQLSSEGNDVAIIDQDAALIQKLSEKLDVMALHGDGASPGLLKEGGIERANMVIAVTQSDAVNMLVCSTANRFQVGLKIARVRNKEFVEDKEDFYRHTFHIDQLINPEDLIAASLSAIVQIPSCVDVTEFDGGETLLCGFSVDGGVPLTARTIQESRLEHADTRFLIVAVSRKGRFFIPRGGDRIESGDKAYVILPRSELRRFVPLVTRSEFRREHRIVLVAGSPESQRLAQALEDLGHHVAVIERDPVRALKASETLRRSIVYQGEATNLDLIREAGTARAEFFIAAGPDDESNLLSALLAKREGAERTVVFTREAEHLPVLNSIGVDVVINPRLATVGAILHLVRRGRILQAAKICHSDAEALHIEVPEKAPAVKKLLRELAIPLEAIVGAVHRDGQVMIPDGQTMLQAGDRVIVFTLPSAVAEIERLFAGK